MEKKEELSYEITSSVDYHIEEGIKKAMQFLESQGVTEENAHEWRTEVAIAGNKVSVTVRPK